jgi:hypothetical protein
LGAAGGRKMTTFEIILACLVIPIAYILLYIAGKYDILNIVCQMLEEKVKCEHDWHIEKKSNVLQLDSMGYPLRLYICKCSKCGASEQRWYDVAKEQADELKTGESFLLTWEED